MPVVRTPVDVASVVRQVRRTNGLTQQDLATAAGVSRRFMSSLEAGKSSVELGLTLRVLDATTDAVGDLAPQGPLEQDHRY